MERIKVRELGFKVAFVNELDKGSLDVHLLQRLACGRVVQLQGSTALKAYPYPRSPACHLLDGDTILTAHCKLALYLVCFHVTLVADGEPQPLPNHTHGCDSALGNGKGLVLDQVPTTTDETLEQEQASLCVGDKHLVFIVLHGCDGAVELFF